MLYIPKPEPATPTPTAPAAIAPPITIRGVVLAHWITHLSAAQKAVIAANLMAVKWS